jgi:hypothetical protein
MHTKNSCGFSVSLLNDDSPQPSQQPHVAPNYGLLPSLVLRNQSDMQRSYSNTSAQSMHSSPRTPSLQRSDSYDSNITNGPITPITPASMGEFESQSSYTSVDHSKEPTFDVRRQFAEHHVYTQPPPHLQIPPMRSMYGQREPSMIDQPLYGPDFYRTGVLQDRGPKRYPCRYKDSHHCEKTFTTSGHASRHSKIHIAEKAVNCTHPSCSKKFTRSDNMKQHLGTHNKHNRDRSRGPISTPSKARTRPAGIPKSLPSRPSSTSTTSTSRQTQDPPFSPYYRTQGYEYPSPRASFSATDAPRPMTAQTESSSGGLDALAAVAASQYQS